jgi:hypothetical protein
VPRAALLVPVLIALLAAAVPAPVMGQGPGSVVLRGAVRDSLGTGIQGVEVVLRDSTERRIAATVTDGTGRFVMIGLPSGGPFALTAERLGYATVRRSHIRLATGESRRIDLKLTPQPVALPRLEVTAAADPLFSGTRTGAATVLEERAVATAPTVERDVVALAALSPMVSVEGDRISAAGQNSRFNSLRVDGAVTQDVFGLSPSGVPGGQANARALPLDAIRQYAVVVAPYDVRQSGFTGALLNATTRQGGETWEGSAFAYYRDAAFSRTADDSDVVRTYGRGATDEFRTESGGFTVGGPLGRARLFVAGEFEGRTRPMPGFHLGVADRYRVGLVEDSVQRLVGILEEKGLEPGSYEPSSLENPLGNLFARVDLPVGGGHELSARYNFISAEQDVAPNRLGFDHYGLGSTGSRIESRTHGLTARLASRVGDRTTNELTLNVQHTADATRTSPQPLVDTRILALDDSVAMLRSVRAGGDPLAHANELDQTIVQLTDHLSHAVGDHLVTVGLDGAWFGIRRRFLPGSRGIWRFDGLAAVERDEPRMYERLVLLDGADPDVSFSLLQFGAYAQDEWSIGDRLSLTLGLRVDWPLTLTRPAYNRTLELDTGIRSDRLPVSLPLLAPRVGFNWSPSGERRTQIRGGVGVFNGLPPLAWIADAYAGTGLHTALLRCQGSATPAFDPDAAPARCADGSGPAVRDITIFDDGFRFPQDIRASLALDQELPWGLVATVEGVYTRALQQVALEDLNLVSAREGELTARRGYSEHVGPRPVFGDPRLVPTLFGPLEPGRRWEDYGRVIRVGNGDRNAALAVAAQLQRRFSDRLDLRLAYTYTRAVDTRSLLYPNAELNYGLTPIRGHPAEPEAALSSFDRTHRVVATAWTRLADWGHGLDVTLMYVGQSGLPYSYVYGTDMNGDGYPGPGAVEDAYNDLLYVPATVSDVDADGLMSRSLLFQLAELEECLAESQGSIVARNSCRTPWSDRLDLRISQGFVVPFGSVRVRADMMNVLNLLNDSWGRVYTAPPAIPVFNVDYRSGCPGLRCALGNSLRGWYSGPRRLNEETDTPVAELPHVLSLPESQWRGQLGIEIRFH